MLYMMYIYMRILRCNTSGMVFVCWGVITIFGHAIQFYTQTHTYIRQVLRCDLDDRTPSHMQASII